MYPATFIEWIGHNDKYGNLIRDKDTGQWLYWPEQEKDWVTLADNLQELYKIFQDETGQPE